VFGSEKYGLSNDDMSLCHLLLRIPTRDEHASMNLGQAAALCLYELSRMPAVAPSPGALPLAAPADAATAGDLERLTTLLTEALAASEYQGLASGQRSRGLHSALRRLQMSSADAHMATGFLRQMLWKLRSGRDEPRD
jgi:tRNA C32,U32 (ribose-2'-O)-methylase TrmJ